MASWGVGVEQRVFLLDELGGPRAAPAAARVGGRGGEAVIEQPPSAWLWHSEKSQFTL